MSHCSSSPWYEIFHVNPKAFCLKQECFFETTRRYIEVIKQRELLATAKENVGVLHKVNLQLSGQDSDSQVPGDRILLKFIGKAKE